MNSQLVIDAIRASLGKAYLVGGAVRDELLGRESGDLDFTTPLAPADVKKRLEGDGYKVLEFSISYGTISLKVAKTKVEITTFRNDIYYPNSRQADVTFENSLVADLNRRDFTINAIATDGKTYIDPLNGREDIDAKIIRAVGDPYIRFSDDPLRMLRAIRFVSTLKFEIEDQTLQALESCAADLRILPGQRISDELNKILEGDNWTNAMSIALRAGLLDAIIPTENTTEIADTLDEQSTGIFNLSDKWTAFIMALSGAGTSSSTYKDDLSKARIRTIFRLLRKRLDWSNEFASRLYDKLMSEYREDALKLLEGRRAAYAASDDSNQYHIEEKIFKLRIRQELKSLNLGQVNKLSLRLLDVQLKDIEREVEQGVSRNDAIKNKYSFICETITFIILKDLRVLGPIKTHKDVKSITLKAVTRLKQLDKRLTFSIGNSDKYLLIEAGIIRLSGLLGESFCSLSETEIMDTNKLILRSPQRLFEIKSSYIRLLTRLRRPPYSDETAVLRAAANKRVAELLIERDNNDIDKNYLSHMIDYYRWLCLSSQSKAEFWKSYDNMNKVMDIMAIHHDYGVGEYLNNISALSYGMRFTEDTQEKISLIRNIIANYVFAKPRGAMARNVPRYELLLDWYNLVDELLKARVLNLQKIGNRIPSLKTYHYRDEDEAFLRSYMPEVDKVRSNMYDVEALLAHILEQRTDIKIENTFTANVLKMLQAQIINKDLALQIFQNILRSQVNEPTVLEGVESPTVQLTEEEKALNEYLRLIKRGENSTVEFKESWRFDTENKQPDPTKEVLKSALRALAALLNTEGGKLFIGVNDEGQITGLEAGDFIQFKSRQFSQLKLQDEMQKVIASNIASTFGNAIIAQIKISFECFEEKTFAVIDVKKSTDDVYLDGKYYIRGSGTTRELTVPEYRKHIRSRIASEV